MGVRHFRGLTRVRRDWLEWDGDGDGRRASVLKTTHIRIDSKKCIISWNSGSEINLVCGIIIFVQTKLGSVEVIHPIWDNLACHFFRQHISASPQLKIVELVTPVLLILF